MHFTYKQNSELSYVSLLGYVLFPHFTYTLKLRYGLVAGWCVIIMTIYILITLDFRLL